MKTIQEKKDLADEVEMGMDEWTMATHWGKLKGVSKTVPRLPESCVSTRTIIRC